QIGLKRTLVELKKKLALLNVVAFFEKNVFDLSVDLRPNLHGLIGFNIPDGRNLHRNITLFHRGNDHRNSGTLVCRSLDRPFVTAGCQENQCAYQTWQEQDLSRTSARTHSCYLSRLQSIFAVSISRTSWYKFQDSPSSIFRKCRGAILVFPESFDSYSSGLVLRRKKFHSAYMSASCSQIRLLMRRDRLPPNSFFT